MLNKNFEIDEIQPSKKINEGNAKLAIESPPFVLTAARLVPFCDEAHSPTHTRCVFFSN
jgi:hypothetical protein